MEIVKFSKNEWRDEFNNLDKQKYNDVVQYDLDLRLWEDDRERTIHNNVSLLVHGFGASPTTMLEYARVKGPHSIPGDKVTFRFKDSLDDSLFFIVRSSFGQIEDIKSLLTTVKAVYDCCWVKNKIGCNLFGQSRGAATITNMLAVLNTSINEWNDGFVNLKIFFSDEDRKHMIQMIKKGVVVLDTPLLAMQMGIKAHVNDILGDIFCEVSLTNFIHDYIFPFLTRGNYSSSGIQVLSSVQNIPEGLKILVSFQNNDVVVGNGHDKEFSEKLSTRLDAQNVWIILGDDEGKQFDDETWDMLQVADKEEKLQKRWVVGGLPYRCIPAHNAGFITLLQSGVLNAFFKKHNCSYYEDNAKLEYGADVLKRSHCVTDFEEYFKKYAINDGFSDS